MVYVTSLGLSVLCDFFVFDLQFCFCLVHGHATVLWCHIAISFSWFSSCFLFGISFYVLRVFEVGWGSGS